MRAWRYHRQASAIATLALVTDATVDAAPGPRARGCGIARPNPHGEAMSTASGRTFHVWGPASYDEGRAYPVVLAFHGWGSSGPGFQKWFKMEDHVEGAAFTVYPDAKTANWDFRGPVDLDFTADLLDALSDTWCVDRAHVLAFGFSYGGRFVHHLACQRPDLVRAVAAGGGSWDPEEGCAPMAVLVVHRTHDDTMPLAGGEEAATRWAKIDGCSGGTVDTDHARGCVAYRGCTAGAVSFCEDTHFDAAWPRSWNHTVREEYRALTWRWFSELR